MIRICAVFLISLFAIFANPNPIHSASLAPQSFNEMYAAASAGKIGILKSAVHRGMNINIQNQEGDTGLCLAIKRWDYRAYNSFRAAGAQPKPYCTTEIAKTDYDSFMSSPNIPEFFKDGYSAFYIEEQSNFWLWALGGAIVAAVVAFIAF